MPPQVLVLNDDVLLQVADYLLGKDALSFSLTSKHVYDLAIHRVFALIECKDRDKLRVLYRTLFYDYPWRAKHIQTLIVRGSVFPLGELRDSDEDWANLPEDMEPPVAPLIVDLLRIAPSIRSLTIAEFEILRASDPGVDAAMAALRRLSRLELFGVRADTRDSFKEEDTAPRMRFLQAGEWHLVTLSLECYNEDDDHFYPPLLSALAAFPRLLTLRLLQFLPRQSFLELDDDVLTTPSFPSIQKLFLKETRPPGFDLVGLCPNVSLVSICTEERFWDPTDWQDPSNENDTMPRALGPRWKPLRSLTLSSRACMYDARTLLDTAFHLEVSCKVTSESMVQPDGPDAPDMVLLLDTLKKVSPVRAQLWVAPVVGGDPVYFWKRVDEAAPRLRFLELKISLTGAQDEDMSWLGNVPNALCALPLVCLRLHLTKTPRYIEFESESESDDCGDGATHAHSVSSREDIQETYNAAAEMRKKLPRRCAGAIRTLKYIAVADEEPSWDDEETFDPCGNWESMDERYGDGAEEYEYRSGWYVEKIKTLRWWRIERSVKKRWRKTKLRPLTPEKGRAVQRFLEEADFESIEHIGEFLP